MKEEGELSEHEKEGRKTGEWGTTEQNGRNDKIKKIRKEESLRARRDF